MKTSLNRCYRLIWSDVHQAFVVVSELSRSHGGRTPALSALLLCCCIPLSYADTFTIGPGTSAGQLVQSGDTLIVQGYSDNSAVNAGGVIEIQSGGSSYSTVLYGIENINGGTSYVTDVNSGGQQNVISGSSFITYVLAGGVQTVFNLGFDIGSTIGGIQHIESGGITTNPHILQGGLQTVDWGSSLNAFVDSGGQQTITGGANVVNTELHGTQEIYGGVVSGTTIYGTQILYGGSSIASVVESGGTQRAWAGSVSSTLVSSGGAQYLIGIQNSEHNTIEGTQYISDGALTKNDSVGSQGIQRIEDGESLFATVQGVQEVYSDGIATSTYINGGQQYVYGGQAVNTTVANTGQQIITSGIAISSVISHSGVQTVSSGGTARDTIVDMLGSQVVSDGGVAYNTQVNSGGQQTVSSGGSINGTVVNSGGTLTLNAGSILSGNVSTNAGVTLNEGATLHASNFVNDKILTFNGSSEMFFSGSLSGSGGLEKDGAGALVLTGSLMQYGGIQLKNGSLVMDGLNAVSDIIAMSGTAISLLNGTSLTGTIDPADLTVDNSSLWTMSGDSTLDTLTLSGAAVSQAPSGSFVPKNLTVTNLVGSGGSITLNSYLQGTGSPTDTLTIDGGSATGTTRLVVVNNGGLGAKTTGNGIALVNAINGATTTANAFTMAPVQAGAYNYSLYKGLTDQSWYLSTQALSPIISAEPLVNYRSAAYLYNAMYAQAMDYDSAVLGTLDGRQYASRGDASKESVLWGRLQAGQLQHRHGGNALSEGNVPDGKTSYSFLQLGADLINGASQDGSLQWLSGLYGASGLSSNDVQRYQGGKAGTVKDTAYSLGAYFTVMHRQDWWLDTVIQGSRHSMTSQPSDSESMTTRGWGYIASVEGGLPQVLSEGIWLEPQIQYQYRGLNLNSGNDGCANVDFKSGSSQVLRAGLKLGSSGHPMVKKEEATPVNWWIRPSVLQTFGTRGDVILSAPGVANSQAAFMPNQNGTSVALDTGIDGQIRPNVTLGIRAGYTVAVKDSSAGGYGGEITLKMAF